MNKHTTSTIATNDTSIDTNSDHNSKKNGSASAKTQKAKAAEQNNIFNIWNWRIETDTAELFVGMFG